MTQSATSPVPATVVIYSGGMDSFTVLHRALREGLAVHALSFDYGQRHARELEVAAHVCRELDVPHQVVDIRAIHGLIDNSALTDASRDMPDGDYASDNLSATVVPNRNMILLSMAIAKAVNIGAGRVDYGAHGGDHVLYPDCRPEFVERMNAVAGIANFEPVRIHAPYLGSTKADILADGLAMGLDYSDTWTCYLGEELACGRCGSCRERLAAFTANGATDPLGYLQRPDTAATAQRPEAGYLQRPDATATSTRSDTDAPESREAPDV
ncbi:7-cyano-7-deazaguanine synthase QueC [Halomonas chromatireducens]|uniref:7-cyano-7-deazaguanine synthase n=1 Tax=Halomonas chromatireducens TaxID=507626 RepID=A0A0X8HDK0_9GAMM|nr:7-cyano-7-deazaguanine synthase QueC [Halomonas chromatireducens]AMD00656.1 7-cyano-7-deazaguanine synthase [Halomonas chromatireducens]